MYVMVAHLNCLNFYTCILYFPLKFYTIAQVSVCAYVGMYAYMNAYVPSEHVPANMCACVCVCACVHP